MIVVTSERCAEYSSAGHPESPKRITETIPYLKSKGLNFITPTVCDENDILLTHTEKLLLSVKDGDFYDPDTPVLPNIYFYARLSAGAAILASQLAQENKVAFSLMRPPGHHAGKNNLGGFCYFNNIAIAVQSYLAKHKTKVSILDIDCHHGNGTEDIFFGNKNVLFVSIHQMLLYPGTGLKSRDNCINIPFPPGTEEKKYMELLQKALEMIKDFNPELLGISIGFDTYRNDPLTQTSLDISTYKKIGEKIAQLGIKRFAVLEGGYSKELPECIYNFLIGFEG